MSNKLTRKAAIRVKLDKRVARLFPNVNVEITLRKGEVTQADKLGEGKRKFFSPAYKNPQSGWLKDWAKPLALKAPGKNGKGGYFNPEKRLGGTVWKTHITQQAKGDPTDGFVLKDFKDWVRHLKVVEHSIPVYAERYRVAYGYRALQVFRNSFKYDRFYSSGESIWPALSKNTIKRRIRHKTWPGRKLREYFNLYKSLDDIERVGADMVRVSANDWKAGLHNNPLPDSHTPKRQFMGFSTYLFDFQETYLKRYLFDSVFVAKQV